MLLLVGFMNMLFLLFMARWLRCVGPQCYCYCYKKDIYTR